LENNKLLPLSIIIFAISIVFSSIWIGHSLAKVIDMQTTNIQISKEKALITEKESAEYLNISIEQFKNILLKDSQEKAGLKNVGVNSYEIYRFIPYIQISNGFNMFSKKELDEWIKYNFNRERP
jgi:hypothetical protein